MSDMQIVDGWPVLFQDPADPPGTGVIPPGPEPEWRDGWPILHEDDGFEDMGDSFPHTEAMFILLHGLRAHFTTASPRPTVLANFDLYYHPTDPTSYVSPDVMVVYPPKPLPEDAGTYVIGIDGPAPVLTVEVLSRRSAQQRDLTTKPPLYAGMGVAEYLLFDPLGRFMQPRLLLKRREAGAWVDEPDTGAGVTSRLGVRMAIEADGQIALFNATTGRRYARPDEAVAAMDAHAAAEARVRELEAEIARLRGQAPPGE